MTKEQELIITLLQQLNKTLTAVEKQVKFITGELLKKRREDKND